MNLTIPADRVKLGVIALGALLLIIVLGGAVPFGGSDEPLPGEVATVAAESRAFDVYLTEQIEFEADKVAAIVSTLPSNLASVVYLAPEGSVVAPGDEIARFDPTTFENERELATAELEDVRAQRERALTELEIRRGELASGLDAVRRLLAVALLNQERLVEVEIPAARRAARAEVETARLELDELAKLRDMTIELHERGFASQEELDRAQRELALAEQGVESRRAQLEVLESVEFKAMQTEQALEIERLENEIERLDADQSRQLQVAGATVSRLDSRLRQLEDLIAKSEAHIAASTITAPVAGIVTYPEISFGDEQRKVQIGDTIWQRQAFLTLPDLGSLVARARVREVEVGGLEPGQPVTLTASALPNLSFAGTVLSIGTVVDAAAEGVRRFEVRISTSAADERLRPGMSGRARIHTHHYDAAVVVPVDAVHYLDGRPVAWLRDGDGDGDGDGWTARPIVLGGTDGALVAIESGLEADATLALVRPADAAAQ
jgi:multidrug resistance efflux pump